MEELVVDVSAGDVSTGDVPKNVVTVSGNDAAEPAASEVPEVNVDVPAQTYETVVDISPLVNAVEAQTVEIKKGFVVVVMLLGVIAGMLFMKGFWTARAKE